MKAAVCREFGAPLTIEEVELAPPASGEVVVRIKACVICHSDIHYTEGAYISELPAVYGHEAAGVVDEVEPLFVAWDAERHDVGSPEVEPTIEQRRVLTQVFGIAEVRHGRDASGPAQLPPLSRRCGSGVQKAGEDLQSRLNHPLHHWNQEPRHGRSLP